MLPKTSPVSRDNPFIYTSSHGKVIKGHFVVNISLASHIGKTATRIIGAAVIEVTGKYFRQWSR